MSNTIEISVLKSKLEKLRERDEEYRKPMASYSSKKHSAH